MSSAYRIDPSVTASLRKRAQRALTEERNRAQEHLDIAGTMIVVLDRNGNVSQINRRGNEILGYKEGMLLERNWFETCLPRRIRTPVQVVFRRLMAGDVGDYEYYENPVLTKSGEERDIAWHNTVLRDSSENIIGILSSGEDVTERRRLEERLQNHLAFVSALLETIPSPIFYKDVDGRYLGCNRAFEEFRGLAKDQIIGRTVHDVAPGGLAEQYQRLDEALLRQGPGAIQSYESTVQSADGTTRNVVFRKATYLDSQGHLAGLVGVVQDTTDLKEAQEELRRREAELAHLGRVASMGEMAASLAHELNQPLHAISNYANGILRRAAQTPDRFTEFTKPTAEIAAEAQRAAQIIQRLRAFLRKREPKMSPVSINDVVRDVLRLLDYEALHCAVTIRLELTEELPQLQADSVQLQQVIVNLAGNAFAAAGGVAPNKRAVTFTTRMLGDDCVELSVADNGVGIPEQQRERVFEGFFTTKQDGLGMGLTICRSIVEAHGGTIRADANWPEGAVFRFTLPVSDQR